jgi:hypothetical protein
MALIPPFYLDCVVAIGTTDAAGNHRWVASGFLYGVRLPDGEPRTHQVYLVTNRHVLAELPHAYLRFNPQADKPARELNLSLFDDNGEPLWFCHPDAEVDVAVAPINFDLLEERELKVAFFKNDQNIATVATMNELGVTEGDFTYVLGFPMGLVGDYRNSVIVRGGTIACIRDTLAKSNNTFLVDAFVFPGNSGGPVILKPEAMAIEGTPAPNASLLIGIVRAYVPYEDVAVSLQTNRPRVVFEENSGLAAVQPVDLIEETWRAQFKPPVVRRPLPASERKREDAE